MGNDFCLAYIGNEIYIEEPDIRNFASIILKVMVIATSDASCVTIASFDGLSMGSFEFSYLWFYTVFRLSFYLK